MRRMCPKTLSAVHVDALLALCKGEGLGYADVPGLRVRREQGRLWFGGETAAEMPERELIPGETLYIPEAGVKIISTLTNYTQEINSPLNVRIYVVLSSVPPDAAATVCVRAAEDAPKN